MDINEKSKEELIAEIVSLRRELDDLRTREKQNGLFDDPLKSAFCRTLVSEVPEYLYSVEFKDGKIGALFHSPQSEEITGYSPEDYKKNPNLWLQMIYEPDRERVLTFLEGLHDPLNCRSIEHRIIHKNGSMHWVLNMSTVHRDSEGNILRQSGFLIDVTGRREEIDRNLRLLDETRKTSLTDDLTQLYNRRAFRILAEQQVLVAERLNQSMLLFYIDLDQFKQINDTYGHSVGDTVLIDMSDILRCTFRESDIIARIGGDEFAVLSIENGLDTIDQLKVRLQANIDSKNGAANNSIAISVSIGISRYKLNESDSIAAMLDRADKDMYLRKLDRTAHLQFIS